MKKILIPVIVCVCISCSESPKFVLLKPGHTGIDFQNTIVESDSFNILKDEYMYNGAGVGTGDLNNDGLPDIFFAGNQVSSRAYLNLGDFRFKDITTDFHGLTNDQWYTGVTFVDINSDGWLDIYLTSTGSNNPQKRRNRLWVNNGIKNGVGPTFTEMAEKYGIADDNHSVAAAFFDYDRDGDLDLYILNNTADQRMNTSYRNKICDGSALNNDKLYRNNGDNTFTDVTIESGIVIEGFGLGLAIGDVNKDGYPDIYVSNDYISNDLLYINQGNGTFRNEIKKYLSYQTTSSMGNEMADVNNDGNPDIITLDMMPESYAKKKQTINGFSYIYNILDEKFGYEHQYLRNMLHQHNGFLNNEMLPFSEVGQLAGIYQTNWSWSPLFADYDNDGDKDLLITNGYPRDLTDKDWIKYKPKNQNSMAGSDRTLINMMPPVKVPNEAFENNGELSFIKKPGWLPDIPSYSYGASFVDLDNDGDLDYVTNNLDDKAFILKNTTIEKSGKNSNFLKIRLIGKTGNTMGIGAKVELWEKGRYQFSEHFLTRGYASSVDPVIHFGISNDISIDSLKITWPSTGYITILKDVASGQTIDIDEKNSVLSENEEKTTRSNKLLFAKAEGLFNYEHDQTDFIDFFLSQKIIPHKFSQIGPCMAKGDIDNDGHEDLIVGSTNKLPTMVYLRKGKGFIKSEFEGLTTQKEVSESDLAILDIDKDGDNDVVAVAGGYDTKEESENQQNLYMAVASGFGNQGETEYQHFLYQNRNGSFVKTALPIPAFPASVIKPCDFNHDGYTDLFIGCRIKRGMFPHSGNSWLIVNEKGRLSAFPASGFDLGMVTDAVWTDYDNDGWEDLLVVREWNSPVLMKNVNGKELVPWLLPDLENHHGIWYSVVAGDFDKDGDDDYILGNLGDNHKFTVSEKYPLALHAIDLDLDGIIDPVMTGYWENEKGTMTEYPVNYLDELKEQSAFFEMKFNDFASFSHTSLDGMIDRNTLKRLEFRLYVNTTSSYILWNDKPGFRWEKLPLKVQVSSVKKMIVQDLNGDNYPDVIMGGNDYTYDVSTGYYDANKGIVLMNKGKNQEKGKPAFDVLRPAQSGLLLQGMVESLLWFKGDSSFVVAGFNRARASVFELKK
jgi:enediyne biosynthesis protein E4